MKTQNPRFRFHAHAIALAGEVTHPFHQIIDVQAPATIPPMGGHSSSHAERYQLLNILRHNGGHSKASGKHNTETQTHEAMAHTSVEGLNIEDVLTVDFLAAELSATYDPYSKDDDQEPQISPRGSKIHGLRIRGYDIRLEPNDELYHELDTMAKVKRAYSDNAAFRDRFDRDAFIGRENELPEMHRRFFPFRQRKPNGNLPTYQGHTIVSLFTVTTQNVPGVFTVKGNLIDVENFGRIHLGELIITPSERHLTMIQADLGSPVNADVIGGGGCVGGGPIDGQKKHP